MNDTIQGLEPQAVYRYFKEICDIPHASGNEKGIADYLEAFAKEHGLFCYRDEIHDVVIKKAGSKGAEHLPAVMMQGHTDMVCEKEPDLTHDFEKDSLKLCVKDGWLSAQGTTLGADNGIAVALMLAVLADASLRHPPLECVFTVQEETGLFGAAQLDGTVLAARTMLNLDSEDEGIATVSCAGGARARLHKKLCLEPSHAYGLTISVSGLIGGHSGADIHLERSNANKLMGRILYAVLLEVPELRLVRISGGTKDNVITRECVSLLAFADEAQRTKAETAAKAAGNAIVAELANYETQTSVAVSQPEAMPAQMMSHENTHSIIKLLFLAPFGAKKRNVQAGGFVVCSSNLGIVKTDAQEVLICFSLRSSVDSLQEESKKEMALLAELFSMNLTIDSEYPGWSYVESSPVREVCKNSYRKLFGKELKVEAIHAGLECGLFAGKLPGLDAIAMGPTVRGAHTPQERMDVASMERFWSFLLEILAQLAQA